MNPIQSVWSLARKDLAHCLSEDDRFAAKTWWQNCPDEIKRFWEFTDILALYAKQAKAPITR